MSNSSASCIRTHVLSHDGRSDHQVFAGAPILRDLPPDARHALLDVARVRAGNAREIIAAQEDALFLVRSGAVRLYLLSSGARELTLAYRQAGDVFQLDWDAGPAPYSLVAEAATDGTVLYRLPWQTFLRQVARSPEASASLYDLLRAESHARQDLLARMVFQPVAVRLARALVELATSGNGSAVHHNQREVAAMIGARESQVSRELATFRGQGFVLSQPYVRPIRVNVVGLRESGLLDRAKE